MRQISFATCNLDDLDSFLSSSSLKEQVSISRSVLVQVFTSNVNDSLVKQLNETIHKVIPFAFIVGATTSGEISGDEILHNSTVLSFSFFESSELEVIALDCSNHSEYASGIDLSTRIREVSSDIAGVLLLATTTTVDCGSLLDGMRGRTGDILFFGAGAGSYSKTSTPYIFYNENLYTEGVIAVVFFGRQLHIEAYTYVGWQALSKEMTITEVESNLVIKKIDGIPAASIYEKYLGITPDERFSGNVLEFPLILQRDGIEMARIPLSYEADGALHFVADVKKGDKVRLTYGNPEDIIKNAFSIQEAIYKFGPEGIFLYTCNCRQLFLQESAKLETQPFANIAPTSGFYSFGEFSGRNNNINLLNTTMIAVGIREGSQQNIYDPEVRITESSQQPKQVALVTRLAHFIEAVVSELEDVNKELQILSDTDKLTQIFNRGKIEDLLNIEIERVRKSKNALSVVLLDIDHFKLVNDLYGHHVGDCVLKQVASTLKYSVQNIGGVVGRWGGEEFMLLLPDTVLESAVWLAESIREVISRKDFGDVGTVTASFGVVDINEFEEDISIFKRVDSALYKAKNTGRNKVVTG